MIECRFRAPSAAVFTLYSYSQALEYRFRVPTAASLSSCGARSPEAGAVQVAGLFETTIKQHQCVCPS
jgi:hypothetical protein